MGNYHQLVQLAQFVSTEDYIKKTLYYIGYIVMEVENKFYIAFKELEIQHFLHKLHNSTNLKLK